MKAETISINIPHDNTNFISNKEINNIHSHSWQLFRLGGDAMAMVKCRNCGYKLQVEEVGKCNAGLLKRIYKAIFKL